MSKDRDSDGLAAGALRKGLSRAEPPFTRKRVGAKYAWADDLMIAHQFAADYGLELWLTDADYQVAKLFGPNVRLVIYPHKTSAGNHHLRVRDEGSKDAVLAQRLMALLDHAAGFNCTFSFHWPKNPGAHRESFDLLSAAGLAALQSAARSAIARAERDGADKPDTGGGQPSGASREPIQPAPDAEGVGL